MTDPLGKQNELKLEHCVNSYCPWSGDRVSAKALTRYKGQVVGFCNVDCRDKFERAITVFDEAIAALATAEKRAGD